MTGTLTSAQHGSRPSHHSYVNKPRQGCRGASHQRVVFFGRAVAKSGTSSTKPPLAWTTGPGNGAR